MYRITYGIAALALAAGLGVAAPAQAVPQSVGVDGCTAYTDGVTVGECAFVVTGGTYEVGIDHDARYGWTRVDCVLDSHFVDAWDYQSGGRDVERTDFGPGLCLVTVATDGGPGYGWVRKV